MLQNSKGQTVTLPKGMNSHTNPEVLQSLRETKVMEDYNHPFFRLDARAKLFNQSGVKNHA